MALLEGAGAVPQQTFVQYNDPQGNKLIALNRDGTIFGQGISLPNSATVPVIQGSLQQVNINTPQTVSITSALDQMYAVYLYLDGNGDGLSTDLLIATLSWIDTSSVPDVHTASIQIVGNSLAIATAIYALFVKGGTTLTLSTAFSAGTFHYDVNVRLVRMP